MKILHVVATGERRGAEVFASDLAFALGDEGVEQRVAVLRPPGPPASAYDPPADTIPAVGWRLPAARMDVGTMRGLWRLVGRYRPDVIQTHGGEPLKYAVVATVGRGIPVVHRRIGGSPPWIRSGPRRVAHAFLMRRASRVVAVADALRRETMRVFGLAPERIVTIPNAVDPGRVAPRRDRAAVRASLGIDPDASVLLSLGALTWEKDPQTHLLVLDQLAEHHDRLVHLFVGDGPLRPQLEDRVRGAGGDARFLGSRADVGDLLGAADVLLFASRPDGMEGMPASVIEAGMARVPVVAYEVAGVAEVIEHGRTGYLVPHGDVQGLAAAVRKLLSDPSHRSEMGDAARARCLERFSIGAIAPRYLEVYRRAVGSRAGGGQR